MADVDDKTDAPPRYVRNRTQQEVFISGHGTVPAEWEGEIQDSEAVMALVGSHVLADVKRPTAAEQKAAAKAAANTTPKDGDA